MKMYFRFCQLVYFVLLAIVVEDDLLALFHELLQLPQRARLLHRPAGLLRAY